MKQPRQVIGHVSFSWPWIAAPVLGSHCLQFPWHGRHQFKVWFELLYVPYGHCYSQVWPGVK